MRGQQNIRTVYRTTSRYAGNKCQVVSLGSVFFFQLLRVLQLNTASGSTAILSRYLCNYFISVTFYPEVVLLREPK